MTSTQTATPLWSTMPGWGIAADLTPPELVNSRQLTLLRRWLGGGLAVVVLACTGAYVLATRDNSSAARSLTQVEARTQQLQAEVQQYSTVTRIEGSVTQVQSEIATLMAGDVDLVKLMGQIRSSLPATMSISSESVTIVLAAVANAAGSSGLDTSGLPGIGTVSLAGNGRTLDDLPSFVDRLKVLPGVADVLPLSNSMGSTGATFSVSFGLTTALISHRFDVSPTATK